LPFRPGTATAAAAATTLVKRDVLPPPVGAETQLKRSRAVRQDFDVDVPGTRTTHHRNC
jgi:hypothetical protein